MTRPTILRAIGFDPGSAHTGYCVVELGRDARGLVRYVEGGVIESDGTESDHFDALISYAHDIIAIERPGEFIKSTDGPKAATATAKALIRASHVSGQVYALARSRTGATPFELGAAEVRRAICGRPNATDAMVKAAVTRWTVDLPRVANHVRDALAVATVALWHEGKRWGLA